MGNINESTFLVTGGGGFIGSHLVHRLVQDGHRVRVIDNFSTGRRGNLFHLSGSPRFELIEGDILDMEQLKAAMAGIHYVLHQAAIPSVPRSIQDPKGSHRVNTEGTLNVLIAAREAGVRRVVFASSSSVYGNAVDPAEQRAPKAESLPAAPLSPYAATKLAGEGYCRAFYESYGLETVLLRYFNIFGPRQDPGSQYASVIPRFAEALLAGRQPVIFGDGHQTRDFTYVENVVEANLKACFARQAAGGTFNVASGRSVSVLMLFQTMRDILSTRIEPRFDPPRPGDVRHSTADISMAREVLGYQPGVGFEEGIVRTLEAFEADRDQGQRDSG